MPVTDGESGRQNRIRRRSSELAMPIVYARDASQAWAILAPRGTYAGNPANACAHASSPSRRVAHILKFRPGHEGEFQAASSRARPECHCAAPELRQVITRDHDAGV